MGERERGLSGTTSRIWKRTILWGGEAAATERFEDSGAVLAIICKKRARIEPCEPIPISEVVPVTDLEDGGRERALSHFVLRSEHPNNISIPANRESKSGIPRTAEWSTHHVQSVSGKWTGSACVTPRLPNVTRRRK